MADEKKETTTSYRSEVRHGGRFGMCKMKPLDFSVETGTKRRKTKKGPIATPVVEKFRQMAPCGYLVAPLRKRLWQAVQDVRMGRVKIVEMWLEKYPEVFTVLGEIKARLPKKCRVKMGYSSKDEDNVLFVIEKN